MRMQRHPLRMLRGNPAVRMLCHTSSGARLCASARHVMHVDGELMYMEQLCATRRCTVSMEVPLNFKGSCGNHIQFMAGIRATQHSGSPSLDALAVVRAECASRSNNRLLWTLRTL